MLVTLKQSFKCSASYFFIDKTNSALQSQFINTCLNLLHDINIKVWSVTCDGLIANVKPFNLLGCDIDKLSHTFTHPAMGEVNVIFDPCHMAKLARGCLADKKFILAPESDVCWAYIIELNKVQEKEGFKFANRLSAAHINFA